MNDESNKHVLHNSSEHVIASRHLVSTLHCITYIQVVRTYLVHTSKLHIHTTKGGLV